jgi:release factor glutamine methyltransferase
MSRWTIGSLLKVTAEYLGEKGSTSALLDAELLLAQVLQQERIELYTEHDRPLTSGEVDALRALVVRRAKGEPVAYLLGRAHFRYLALEVTPAVLIPRPETEELVDAVLDWLRVRPLIDPTEGLWGRPEVADIGTGSGAIALSLAQEAGVRVLATDSSREALVVAARNRAHLGLNDMVELREADLLGDVEPGSLRLVVSNPPYVTDEEFELLAPDVRLFEPRRALVGGRDGLDVYRRLLPAAARALGAGGSLFVEVGQAQAAAVSDLARQAGFDWTAVSRDLSGKERIVRATLPGVLTLTPEDLKPRLASLLRQALPAGALLGVPTDTVYGVAAAWDSEAGVRALVAAKGRPPDKPLQVLFPSLDTLAEALPDLDEPSLRVLTRLLPGPYTFVVRTEVERPELVGSPDSLGVRVPDSPALQLVLGALGVPLAASSANFTGEPGPARFDGVDPALLAHLAVAVVPDEGERQQGGGEGAESGVPSTVVDLRPLAAGRAALVLREGAVPAEKVLESIGAVLAVLE